METPLDKAKLLQCLFNLSMNPNPAIIHEANANIMEMENNQNFLALLLELFEEENVNFFNCFEFSDFFLEFQLKKPDFSGFQELFCKEIVLPEIQIRGRVFEKSNKTKINRLYAKIQRSSFFIKTCSKCDFRCC